VPELKFIPKSHTHMKNALRPLLALTASLFVAGSSFAQTATTVPVGFMTYTLTNGALTPLGVPLLHAPVFTGLATGVTSTTLTATGVTWTPDQFITAGTPFFVTIRTGAQTGRTLLVSGNTATTLTLDTEDTPLDASGFVVAANDSFELYQGDTLASMFGSTADGGGNLSSGIKGASSPLFADGIQIWNGARFVNYFFNTNLGHWVMAGGGTVNQNGVLLYPDDGLQISRRGATTTLTIVGRVPATPLMTKFVGGSVTITAIRFPTDTTLGALNFSGPGAWLTGNSPLFADTVNIWNGVRWVPYFKNNSAQWIQVGGDGNDKSATVIPAGSAIQISKRGTGTGSSSFYSQTLPYTP
jgi:uncharacterized protein (TIGR02597 family)